MIIRPFQSSDIKELERIHKEGNYEVEYPFDVFNDPHFVDLFAVVDDGGLITAGGLRLTPEVIIATDKSRDVRTRREALLKILQVAEFLTKRDSFQGFTASTDNEDWYRQMIKYGFRPSKGKPLYYSVI